MPSRGMILFLLPAALCLGCRARGPAAPPPAGAGTSAATSDLAVDRGLQFLAAQQKPDGAVGTLFPVATTSLAGLSFLSRGSRPGAGVYGEGLTRAVDYLTKSADRTGFITERSGPQSRMHGHAYALLFLSEALAAKSESRGMNAEAVLKTVQRAVEVIELSQSPLGGWGYEPLAGYDEASVTTAALLALQAAQKAGAKVGRDTLVHGLTYLRKTATPDGSFRYSLSVKTSEGTFALTAGSVGALLLSRDSGSDEVRAGLSYLMKHKPTGGVPTEQRSLYYFYANFHAALAMRQAESRLADEWSPLIGAELRAAQQADGSWAREYDPAYCTAFATLILQMPGGGLRMFRNER